MIKFTNDEDINVTLTDKKQDKIELYIDGDLNKYQKELQEVLCKFGEKEYEISDNNNYEHRKYWRDAFEKNLDIQPVISKCNFKSIPRYVKYGDRFMYNGFLIIEYTKYGWVYIEPNPGNFLCVLEDSKMYIFIDAHIKWTTLDII